MSERQQFLQTKLKELEHSETKSVPTATPAARGPRQSSYRSFQRFLKIWFLICIILLSLAALFVFSYKGVGRQAPATPHASLSTLLGTGTFRSFLFPRSDSEVMRPALDHQGRVWFGDMGQNALVVFDPRTQSFRYLVPPQGHNGIMGVQVAPDDTVWFAEQFANYIGHYFPATGYYQIYPLPWLTAPDPVHPGHTQPLPSAPNELALDTHGAVWFTEFNADLIGRLDPNTGLMQHYALSAKTSIQTLDPYGVTLDPQGTVWFTEAGTNQLGRLDPTTGALRLFSTPGSYTFPMEVTSDSQGSIWLTSFTPDLLLRLSPYTGTFTVYAVPAQGSARSALYGLLVTPANEVWITMLEENMLARLDVTTQRFVFYHIPTPDSEPLGLVMDKSQTLWFTSRNAVGMLRPE